jgi:hypothetical protein
LKHNKETIRVTKKIYVPAQHIGLFMGQRFTPRQLMEDVYPLLVADGALEDLKPFIQWMLSCGTSTGTERVTSPLLLPEVKVPLMDPTFLEWIKNFLDRTIPGRNGELEKQGTETSEHQVAGVVAKVLQEHQLALGIKTTAKGVKAVSDYFKPQLTAKLIMLCDVEIETDLPAVWSDIPSGGGKHDDRDGFAQYGN